jgi:hypothetical protein
VAFGIAFVVAVKKVFLGGKWPGKIVRKDFTQRRRDVKQE